MSRNLCVRPRSSYAAIVAAMAFVWLVPATLTFARDDADLLIARTPPHTAQEEQRMFHVPPGFRVDTFIARFDDNGGCQEEWPAYGGARRLDRSHGVALRISFGHAQPGRLGVPASSRNTQPRVTQET